MTNSLFNEFPEISTKQWKQKIQFELKGEDYNDTLVTKTPEDINIKPFYNSDDFPAENNSIINPEWNICEKIFVAKASGANVKAIENIKKGAQSILFFFPDDTADLHTLFKSFPFKTVAIHIETAFLSVDFVKQLVNFFKNKQAHIFLHIDIIGNLARTGNWYFNFKKDFAIYNNIQSILTDIPQFKTVVTVDLSLYQNAGANMVQQLAYGLAHVNEYFTYLERKDFAVTFKIAVGSNYFFEIGKLKALRILWKTIASEYNSTANCYLFCTPTKRNKTLYDYNVNMLRTTTESMSAIIGGADTICTLPYDSFYHKDKEFASRIARNQLLILKHESYFDKVKNPSDGSYYIESITEDLAKKGLELFKKIEAKNGFLTLLKEHLIQKKIKENANTEQTKFNEKSKILVGTNKYQNQKDRMQNELELYPFVKTEIRKTLIEPIIERRLAEASEQERLKKEVL
ncbi:MAG: methylmalonyl-CoA mutase subunit beta [Galbibacter orientalis]|uniref:methylmalonyl-CoA mutase subunit beta n=1 Tax=Galbibacter orientalis TaxID=453852 RepID=UPI003001D216